MKKEQIRIELESHSDEKYRKFTSHLIPGVSSILGVRLPELRKMAKRLARADWQKNLSQLSDDTFEEIMLQGMVIGYADCPADERLKLVSGFVPKIDNWPSGHGKASTDSGVRGAEALRHFPADPLQLACVDAAFFPDKIKIMVHVKIFKRDLFQNPFFYFFLCGDSI